MFGIFQVSILHNLVHLAFGVTGLAMARTVAGARIFLLAGGAVYLVLWLYGLLIGHHSRGNSYRSTTPTTGCTSCSASE